MSGLVIDRIRLQRRVGESARLAWKAAVAVTKSAGHFLGACSIVALFGCGAYRALLIVRTPDTVLVHRAIAKAHDAAAAAAFDLAHPSALAERDSALALLIVMLVLMAVGVLWLVEWWQSLPFGRKAAK